MTVGPLPQLIRICELIAIADCLINKVKIEIDFRLADCSILQTKVN